MNCKARIRETSMLAMVGLILMITSQTSAFGSTIVLGTVAVGTAVDNGPQDGLFDSFSPLNLGAVNNNGFTSFRTAFDFQVPGIPAGSTINAATVTLFVNFIDGTRQIALYGYTGNLIYELNDFSAGGLVARDTLFPAGGETVILDVTPFVASLATTRRAFAGFNLREEPANSSNFGVMHFNLDSTTPILTIDYTTPAPEPSPVWLLGTGFAALGSLRRLR